MPPNTLATACVPDASNDAARKAMVDKLVAEEKFLNTHFLEFGTRYTNIEQIQDDWRFEDDIPEDQWQGQIMAKAVADACYEDPAFAQQLYTLNSEPIIDTFSKWADAELRTLERGVALHNRHRAQLGAQPYTRPPLSDVAKRHGVAKVTKAMRDQQAAAARDAAASAHATVPVPDAAAYRRAVQAVMHGGVPARTPHLEAYRRHLVQQQWAQMQQALQRVAAEPTYNVEVPVALLPLIERVRMQSAEVERQVVLRAQAALGQHWAGAPAQLPQGARHDGQRDGTVGPRAGPSRPMPMMMGPDVPGGYYVPADARAVKREDDVHFKREDDVYIKREDVVHIKREGDAYIKQEDSVYMASGRDGGGRPASRTPQTIVLVER
ncbi:hypothetical protein PsYK624_042090 [Phanerochaete sordida]|uniref:Uncharacterized protein n=1 Tax=Phanerochaete sordida TaxID=48140 RepID=A0A9P3G4J6_9APHY|nr:hypothetical protein PsYK624_042090 [Phanerochaete sordida]